MATLGKGAPLPVAHRVEGFSYAIRNVVREAHALEAQGRTVRYLNIGDPVPFGFPTPPHLVEVVERALRDGHNGYGPSAGLPSAREAIAADYGARGVPMSPDRVIVTAGASEGIDLALCVLADVGDDVLVPLPTYPLYTAVLAKLGARASYYRCDPARGWAPDLEDIQRLVTPRTRALVVINPNNPTGAVYDEALLRELISFADGRGFVVLADEVYADLAYAGPVRLLGSLEPDAAILSFGSLSKGSFAPGWRTGWVAVGRTPRLDGVLAALGKFADGRLCSSVAPQYAIQPALQGPKDHQVRARAALSERARLVAARLNGGRLRCDLPSAAFYAMPQVELPPGMTDEQFVLGLVREKGILCVHGSGFGLNAHAGFFRLVFLPPPEVLARALDDIVTYAKDLPPSG